MEEKFYQTKLISLIRNCPLEENERHFLFDFAQNGSQQTVKGVCLYALQTDNRLDYFLSLVYCHKIKKYLEGVGYLDQKNIAELLKFASKLSGLQAKQLFNEVIINKNAKSFNPKEMLDSLQNIISVVQSSFSKLIKNKSEESDETKIRLLREKLQNS